MDKISKLWNHPAGPKTILGIWGARFRSDSIADSRRASLKAFSEPLLAPVAQKPTSSNAFRVTRKNRSFWAPTFKWMISISNMSDFQRPVEQISLPQQLAVTATGMIWSRYSLVINPVNYNLFAVNVFMAFTGLYQLYRKQFEAPGGGFAAQGAK